MYSICSETHQNLNHRFDYSVHANRAELFYADIRKYYPYLKDDSLQAGYAGIRPKVSGPGQPPGDFVIQVSSWTFLMP